MIKILRVFIIHYSLFIILFLVSKFSFAQNIDNISFKKGIKVNGSVNASMVNYAAGGIENRRDPLNCFLTGSMNVNLFGFDMPFSFSVSNAAKSYTQPFNQMRIAPKYKWFKAYVGDASMNFSNYTLSGVVFHGAGVELTPGKWNVSAMYGCLKKTVAYDDVVKNYNDIAYKRMGYGVKLGYSNNGDNYSLILFSAKDDAGSLKYVPIETQLNPMQNVAVSVSVKKTIIRRFFVDIEYAVSSLNTNNRAQADKINGTGQNSNFLNTFLKPNGTTRYFDAINAGLGYNADKYTIQLRYERVAPEYQTLGAYYFNNDFRNITIAPSVRLLKNKLNINSNIGIQQNNLNDTRNSTTKRFVGNINASMALNQQWSFMAAYSNFSTYTNMRPQEDPFFQNKLDTLNFYQLTNNISTSAVHSFGTKESIKSLTFSTSYQTASEKSGGTKHPSNFISNNLGYTQSLTKKDLTLNGSLNYNTNTIQNIKSIFWGPNINISKGFFEKKLRTNCGFSYNKTTTNNQSSGGMFNARIGGNYAPNNKQTNKKFQGKHNVGVTINYLNRGGNNIQKGYSEITSTVNYMYSF